jgi:hypothetical protein
VTDSTRNIIAIPSSQITVDVAPRRIGVHLITTHELDRFAEGFSSLASTLFGVCGGALVSLAVTLVTVPVDNAKVYASLVAGSIVALLGSIFFGGQMMADRRMARTTVASIKEREELKIAEHFDLI